jgi:hypothetical protein
MTEPWFDSGGKPNVEEGMLVSPLYEQLRVFYLKHNPENIPLIPNVISNIERLGEDTVHESMMHKYGASIWKNKAPLNRQARRPDKCEDCGELLCSLFVFMVLVSFALRVMFALVAATGNACSFIGCLLNPWCPVL